MSSQEMYENLSGLWGRTVLNTQQLKLGLGSLDAAGPALVESEGQVVNTNETTKETSTLFTTW